jgi:DNA topoisomerase-1
VIRTGRFGRFISCSGFPECRYGRSVVTKTGALCPLCHGDLVERKTRQKKRIFYGCGNYPTCNFAIWEKPVPEPCPKCGGLMVIPKVGQDPVCYEEVIAVQRKEVAGPQQDGAKKTTRTPRRNAATSTESAANAPATTTTRRTAARKKAGAASEDSAAPGAGVKRSTAKSKRASSTKAASSKSKSATKAANKKTTTRATTTTTKRSSRTVAKASANGDSTNGQTDAIESTVVSSKRRAKAE